MKKTKSIFFAYLKRNKIPEKYTLQLRDETLDQLKSVSGLSAMGYVMPLFLIFWVADCVFYPFLKVELGLIRIAAVLITLVTSFIIQKSKSINKVEMLSSLMIQTCSTSIIAMLYLINDTQSNYYSGLFLVITGAALSFRYQTKTLILNFLFIFFSYNLTTFLILKHDKSLLFNSLVLFGVMLISLITRIFMNQVQLQEFIARKNLNEEILERNVIIERKTAENIRYKSLEKQFSPQVIKLINDGSLTLDKVVDAEISVVFYDIVNSTKKANEINSVLYQNALNLFLEETIKIMLSYDLTIGGFLGDGILGFTNQPFAQKNFIDRILLCSIDINNMIQNYQNEFQKYWKGPFSLTTGVSKGNAKVGFFGSTATFKHYTAIGPVVNKAKRLSSCCTENQILIDDTIYPYCLASNYIVGSAGKFELKGFQEPQNLYSLIDKPNNLISDDDGSEVEVILNENGIYEFKTHSKTKKIAA